MAIPKPTPEGREESPASNGDTPCCCLECRRPAAAENAENSASKQNVKSPKLSAFEIRIGSTKTSPRSTTVDKCMPKVRNRNQTTTTHIIPTMHRKSKSKSKTKTTIGSALISTICPTSDFQNSTHDVKNMSIYEEHYQQSQHQSQPEFESKSQLQPRSRSRSQNIAGTTSSIMAVALKKTANSTRSNSIKSASGKKQKKTTNSMRFKMLVPLPTLGATSFVTFLTVICIETVLLSTMSSCAKTFYMHWNTSNSM